MRDKKAASKTLVSILITIIGFIFALILVTFFLGHAKGAALETVCRTSVALREAVTLDQWYVQGITMGKEIKLAPLMCKTQTFNLPDSKEGFQGDKEEDIQKHLADLVARCWWQFGEGNVIKNVFADYFLSDIPGTKDKCFICYIVEIESIDGKSTGSILGNDFESYLATTMFDIESVPLEICNNKIDDDGDEKIDEKDEDCDPFTDQCVKRGGECKQSCASGKEQLMDWECSYKRVCCLDKEKIITYLDYVQFGGGGGKIEVEPNLMFVPKREKYAITFVSYTDDAHNAKWYMFDNPEITRIFVSRLNTVSGYCNVQ